jgi:FdhD protein
MTPRDTFAAGLATSRVQITSATRDGGTLREDLVAVELPLEITLAAHAEPPKPIAVTMRTPGHDRELAAGFLFTEGIVTSPAQIVAIEQPAAPDGTPGNRVEVTLSRGTQVDLARLERHFYTTSSCGICGKKAVQAIHLRRPFPLLRQRPPVNAECIGMLPAKLRAAQEVFSTTGGLHASAWFSPAGDLLCLFEDVGRHNALDKLVGGAFLAGKLPLSEAILLVSGRASFELVQKALMAGIPCLAAIGAPSSLAVDLARSAGMTLLGFVRSDRFNCYSGEARLNHEARHLPLAHRPT